MTTPWQIEGNRCNARLSTGSKTPEGKAIARTNALKHGLTAQQVLRFDETTEDFETFVGEIVGALRPRNPATMQRRGRPHHGVSRVFSIRHRLSNRIAAFLQISDDASDKILNAA
jgi:hypothetical protein